MCCGGRWRWVPIWAGTQPLSGSANVGVIGIAKRYGHPISFWQFTRYGLLVTVVSIALCVPYLWLRYLA